MNDRFDRGQVVQLIQQDCIEWMRAQLAGSVDCVVTSPPYNLGVRYGKHDDSMSVRGYLDWMPTWFGPPSAS